MSGGLSPCSSSVPVRERSAVGLVCRERPRPAVAATRTTRTRILVSEVMLQQTQVDRVRAALGTMARAVAHAGGSRRRVHGRRDRRVAGARLQPASSKPCTERCRRFARDGWPGDLTILPGVGPYTAGGRRQLRLRPGTCCRSTRTFAAVQETHRRDIRRALAPQSALRSRRPRSVSDAPRAAANAPLAHACPSRGEALRAAPAPVPVSRARSASVAPFALRAVAAGLRPPRTKRLLASLARDGLVTPCGRRPARRSQPEPELLSVRVSRGTEPKPAGVVPDVPPGNSTTRRRNMSPAQARRRGGRRHRKS